MSSRMSSQFPEEKVDHRRTQTRQRIQEVALELFAQKGYDDTSLQELADRLQVTKAALYYHFKTKEEIARSLFEDVTIAFDGFLAWAGEQPKTAEGRRAILRRYQTFIQERRWPALLAILKHNPVTLREMWTVADVASRMVELNRTLRPPGADARAQVRTMVAIVALHVGLTRGQLAGRMIVDASDEEVAAAAVEVALDLIS
jgi:AcrR family transcriptional regulator